MVRKVRWAILFGLIVLGGGTLWLLLGHEPIEEGRCKLRRRAIGNPAENQVAELAWQLLEPEPARPDEVRDLPHGFDQPCFYHVEIHGERLAVALDWSHGRLCLDTDHDGRFANERCFRAKSVKLTPRGNRRWRFGPIRLNVDNGTGQGHVAFYMLHHAVDRPTFLSVYPASYRSGKLRLDGQVYQVAVVDGDYDGRFGSVVSLPVDSTWRWPRSDVFAIDGNRDGKFEVSLYAHRSEVMPLSRMVLLGSRYYAVDVAPDGSQLEPDARGTGVRAPRRGASRSETAIAALVRRGRSVPLPDRRTVGPAGRDLSDPVRRADFAGLAGRSLDVLHAPRCRETHLVPNSRGGNDPASRVRPSL